MSNSDTIFLAANEPLDATARWIAAALALEPVVSAIDRYSGVAEVRDRWPRNEEQHPSAAAREGA